MVIVLLLRHCPELPGHDPNDLAIALEFRLVPSRRVMAGGVTAAKRPAFLRKSRRA